MNQFQGRQMAFADHVDRLDRNGVFDRNSLDPFQREILNDLSIDEVNFLVRIKKQMGGAQPFAPQPNGNIF
jgi:hypothetical protein